VLLGKDICRPKPLCDGCPLDAACARRGLVRRRRRALDRLPAKR